jgi:toxin-antitoxin system PIN domain toxin
VIVPDVNLLMYAHISSFRHHGKARTWWEALMNGRVDVGITGPVLFAFLRLATNRKVIEPPMSVDVAVGHAESWLDRPHVHFLSPGTRHLDITFALLRHLGTGGNLTTDAQIAATAIEHQAEVHSNDLDFGRFPQLRWRDPIA